MDHLVVRQVHVGQHAKYGGFWCKNVDCATYWSRVNVQLDSCAHSKEP